MTLDFRPFDQLRYVNAETDQPVTLTRQPNGEWTGDLPATATPTLLNDRWVQDALDGIPDTHRVLLRNGEVIA